MLFTQLHKRAVLQKIIAILLAVTGVFMGQLSSHAQGLYTDFGQNRVQFKDFEWQYFRTENFDAYFYSGGRELAAFTIKAAERHIKGIEKVLDFRLSGRVEFLVYNTQGDLRQSNLGLTDQQVNTGGYTRVYDNKIFVYFNGNHEHLTAQIKAGLAEVIINEMLYGGSFTERIQNAALLSLPEWYTSGLTAYIGEGWTTDDESRMKEAIKSKKFKRFNALSEDDAVFAGKSIWKYLIETNDERVVSNLIYITRVTRSTESALYYVLGAKMREVTDNWIDWYTKQYEKDDNGRQLPSAELKIKKRFRPYLQPVVSVHPQGKELLLVTNAYGAYKVHTYDTETGKMRKIFKGGFRFKNAKRDKSFPMAAWHPGGEKVAVVYERKGGVRLTIIDTKTGKRELIKLLKLEKITGFDFNESGNLMLLTALRKGQSDLYILDLKTRKERQLTSDLYDDKDARFIDGSSRIIFSSNRVTDSLGLEVKDELRADNNFDIFIYDLENQSDVLHRLTYTPYVNESHPQQYTNEYYTYLTDYNGIRNRYVARVEPVFDYYELRVFSKDTSLRQDDTLLTDTFTQAPIRTRSGKVFTLDSLVSSIDTVAHYRDLVYTYPASDYTRNILAHDVCYPKNYVAEFIYVDGRLRLYKTPMLKDIPEETKTNTTYYTQSRQKKAHLIKTFKRGPAFVHPSGFTREGHMQTSASVQSTEQGVKTDSVKVNKAEPDTSKYYFLNEFSNRENFNIEQVLQQQDLPASPVAAKEKGIRLGTPRMYDLVFIPDYFVTQFDNTVINTYYQPYQPGSAQFFNPGFNGMFKLGINDLFNDKRILGGFRVPVDLRGSDVFVAYENNTKRIDKRYQYFRQSRFTDGQFDFQKNTVNELRAIYKYPFSERTSLRLNVFGRQDRNIILSSDAFNAQRDNVERRWAGGKLEYVYDNTIAKGLNLFNGLRFKIFAEGFRDVERKNTTMLALGFDFRNYMKLHRQIILATRFTANTSLGSARIVYFLGGVDNWLTPRFNNDIEVAQDKNFVYQALATNMRGFTQNIRNGTTFAVINNEIRIPIFAYLSNRPVKSDFLKNFMIVPFADIGTAWSGPNPYSNDNTFNKRIINRYPLTITVINIREPIVGGVGGGLRMKLFGYYVRGDMAWGIEDREMRSKPVYYVSLSTDF